MSRIETDELNRGMADRRTREEEYARREEFSGEESQAFDRPGLRPGHSDTSANVPNVGDLERMISMGAGVGLAAVGLARGRWDGLLLTALGAGLAWRGYTGRCQCYAALGIDTARHNPATAVPAQQGEKVEKTITICRPPAEIYQFWRQLEKLPRVMKNLKRVEPIDSQRSHWVAKGPLGPDVEWDAEIINERENEMIAWRSLHGGDIDTAGSIHFKPSSREGCTDIVLSMKYNPPAGKAGAQVASWLGEGLEQKLEEDLHRLKELMESGALAGSGTS